MADPAQGSYKFKEGMKSDYVWAVRSSPILGSTYDIIFEAEKDNKDGTC